MTYIEAVDSALLARVTGVLSEKRSLTGDHIADRLVVFNVLLVGRARRNHVVHCVCFVPLIVVVG